jgi:predicted house-cleaning noncanonical NTP pyrophosphatase (MazG superfamily)
MNSHALIDFLTNKMSMTDVYQPAVIKELLLHEGSRSKAELASSLSSYDLAVQEYYERIVMRWPRLTLQKHGIISYDRKAKRFSLCEYPTDEQLRRDAIQICSSKIDAWLGRKRRESGTTGSGSSLRYEVLKAASGKCELCGIPAKLRPIDVDHVVPRSKFNKHGNVLKDGKWIAVDSRDNLQALCFSCNRAKRDSDQTDFRVRSKLVRDLIPDIIRGSGREPLTECLHGKALMTALCDKLIEEHAEFIGAEDRAGRLEELADMIEVITAIARQLGASSDELVGLVEQKRIKRGGFDLGILYKGG